MPLPQPPPVDEKAKAIEDEVIRLFRGQMLLFITEAWAVRKQAHSDLGLTLDLHHLRAGELMREIVRETLKRVQPASPLANGVPIARKG